ncbi:MAG: FxLD family lanthipeptide [Micromonosporaceae bacterium]
MSSSTVLTEERAPEVTDEFDLDVTLLEVADEAGLIELTDNGCGSTCGACTTNVA